MGHQIKGIVRISDAEFEAVLADESVEIDGVAHFVERISPGRYVVRTATSIDDVYVLNSECHAMGASGTTEVKTTADLLIEKLGVGAGTSTGLNVIKAPMPGLVLKVAVSPEQEVKKGDLLLVLEAMKMENNICAPADGIVSDIACKEGAAVTKDQLLVSLSNNQD